MKKIFSFKYFLVWITFVQVFLITIIFVKLFMISSGENYWHYNDIIVWDFFSFIIFVSVRIIMKINFIVILTWNFDCKHFKSKCSCTCFKCICQPKTPFTLNQKHVFTIAKNCLIFLWKIRKFSSSLGNFA